MNDDNATRAKQHLGFQATSGLCAFCTVITPNVREYTDWQHLSPNSHKHHDLNSVYQASRLWNDGIGESATKIVWLFSWRVNVLTPIENVKGNERARIDGVIPLLFCYTQQSRPSLFDIGLHKLPCSIEKSDGMGFSSNVPWFDLHQLSRFLLLPRGEKGQAYIGWTFIQPYHHWVALASAKKRSHSKPGDNWKDTTQSVGKGSLLTAKSIVNHGRRRWYRIYNLENSLKIVEANSQVNVSITVKDYDWDEMVLRHPHSGWMPYLAYARVGVRQGSRWRCYPPEDTFSFFV